MPKHPFEHLAAPLWLMFAGREFLVGKSIELLRQIDAHGSLTKAAQAVPMSYKSAWDLIDKLNNTSGRPVVVTATGGRNGGGTVLSDYGKSLVSLYGSLERGFSSMHATFEDMTLDTDRFFRMVKGLSMKTSARNQIAGTVSATVKGMVATDVTVDIGDHEKIHAVITNESVEELGLTKGSEVIVLVKSSAVILFPGHTPAKCSAENMLCGKVGEVRLGMVNGEVIVELPSGKTLAAMVTKDAVGELKLTEGADVCAAFAASQVILAIPM